MEMLSFILHFFTNEVASPGAILNCCTTTDTLLYPRSPGWVMKEKTTTCTRYRVCICEVDGKAIEFSIFFNRHGPRIGIVLQMRHTM